MVLNSSKENDISFREIYDKAIRLFNYCKLELYNWNKVYETPKFFYEIRFFPYKYLTSYELGYFETINIMLSDTLEDFILKFVSLYYKHEAIYYIDKPNFPTAIN